MIPPMDELFTSKGKLPNTPGTRGQPRGCEQALLAPKQRSQSRNPTKPIFDALSSWPMRRRSI